MTKANDNYTIETMAKTAKVYGIPVGAPPMVYDIYLIGPIKAPEEYVEEFHVINNLGENDTVRLHINSGGGIVTTALQFMDAIKNTEGTVVANLVGDVMSAATFITLACHGWKLSDHMSWMSHTYSGGAYGNGHELERQMEFQKGWSAKLMRDIYKDFFSEEEIEQMLKGVPYYLDSEEVGKRLEAYAEARQAEFEAEHEEHENTLADIMRGATEGCGGDCEACQCGDEVEEDEEEVEPLKTVTVRFDDEDVTEPEWSVWIEWDGELVKDFTPDAMIWVEYADGSASIDKFKFHSFFFDENESDMNTHITKYRYMVS